MKRWILFFCAFPLMMANAEPPSKEYKLVWNDEFDGTTLDTTKWDHRALGQRRNGYIVKECTNLDGKGQLVFTTRKEGDQYQSGQIGSEGKFQTTFGYFETKVKFQTQAGHWSAFWLQSPTISQAGDSKKFGAEIDIMEYLVNYKDCIYHTVHWDGYGDQHKEDHFENKNSTLSEGYHLIGLEWTPEGYTYFVDDKPTFKTTKGISHRSEYIIVGMEFGDWSGNPDKYKFPDYTYFDYVRVYQKDLKDKPAENKPEEKKPETEQKK